MLGLANPHMRGVTGSPNQNSHKRFSSVIKM